MTPSQIQARKTMQQMQDQVERQMSSQAFFYRKDSIK